jgi:hypothetical protein
LSSFAESSAKHILSTYQNFGMAGHGFRTHDSASSKPIFVQNPKKLIATR